MGMQGFSDEFKTPEQYITDITYNIWERRGIGRLYDWYALDAPVHTPHAVETEIVDVFNHTLGTMHMLPNRELLAEEIIIGDRGEGFLSSHRVRSVGRHEGEGYYGKPTNRPFVTLAIADCMCRENKVVAEWLLSDQARIALQLGLDPVEFGRTLGRNNPAAYTVGNAAMRQRWQDPDGLTIVGDSTTANQINDTYAAIWNDKRLDLMEERYDRALRFDGPSGQLCYGLRLTADLLTGIIASIPDGRYEPHHIIVKQGEDRPIRVALRWSFAGTHRGIGRYGARTGCPLTILGISHFELRDGRIINEWMVVDETAVYAQIAAYAQG